jgi:hypothetical protein
MQEHWNALRAKHYPPRVVDTMSKAIASLTSAVGRKNTPSSTQAAIDVAQSALDLELLYRGNVEADRFLLHTQQLRVHAAAKDIAGVNGEVAALEWIRYRLAPTMTAARLADLDADLRAIRGAASAGNMSAAADLAAQAAARLRRT